MEPQDGADGVRVREKGGWEAPPPGHMRKGRSPSLGISDLESWGAVHRAREQQMASIFGV